MEIKEIDLKNLKNDNKIPVNISNQTVGDISESNRIKTFSNITFLDCTILYNSSNYHFKNCEFYRCKFKSTDIYSSVFNNCWIHNGSSLRFNNVRFRNCFFSCNVLYMKKCNTDMIKIDVKKFNFDAQTIFTNSNKFVTCLCLDGKQVTVTKEWIKIGCTVFDNDMILKQTYRNILSKYGFDWAVFSRKHRNLIRELVKTHQASNV